MEIDSNIYTQYRDTPFKPDDIKIAQQKAYLLNEKIKNPNMDEYANYVLENTQKMDSSKNKRNTYDIILRTSFDKNKNKNNLESSSSHEQKNDSTNIETANSFSKNNTSVNFKAPTKLEDNIQQSQEEIENNNINQMLVDEDNDNKVNINNDKNENENEKNNNNEEENNQEEKYYNPFCKKNIKRNNNQSQENCKSDCEENKNLNNKGKIPIITLTTFSIPKTNIEEKSGKFSFLNLFSGRKRCRDTKKNEEIKIEEVPKNHLETLEDKIKDKNISIKENKEENENIEKTKDKCDFVLSVIDSKNKEIAKKEEDQTDKINIVENSNDKGQNSQSFIIKAEPIMNNNKNEDINNKLIENNNLYEPSQISDLDKSSQYTSISRISITSLFDKKSKCCPLLMAILLGSCGLFYLLYKKINLKELLAKCANLFKLNNGLFNYISSIFGAVLQDFMERYSDIYRLLIGIIIVLFFWFVLKILMKKFMKRRKK